MDGDMILVEKGSGSDFSGESCTFCRAYISVPYYRSKEDGDTGRKVYYIHKTCADLPPEIEHELHPGHNLIRLCYDDQKAESRRHCNCCRNDRLVYYSCLVCPEDEFIICIKCVLKTFPITHKFHDHPLISFNEIHLVSCVACRELRYGISFECTTCPFTVHQDCVSPRIVKLPFHRHEVKFIYSIPQNLFVDPICCRTCREQMEGQTYAYYCGRCRYFFHIHDCRTCREQMEGQTYAYYCGRCRYFFHIHDCRPAVLCIPGQFSSFALAEEEEAHDNSATKDCFACAEKISVPYYFRSHYAEGILADNYETKVFFLHKFCAELPRVLEHQLHPGHSLRLPKFDWERDSMSTPTQSEEEISQSSCSVCHVGWEGLSYSCVHASCQFTIDAICAMKTTPFVHESHPHPLFLSPTRSFASCRACNTTSEGPSYQCNTCRFWVHQKCASVPKFMESRLHPHKLNLIYCLPENRNHSRCQVCRQEIKPHNWAYHCAGCRFFTHIHDCLDPCREMEEFDYEAALASAPHLPPPNESITMGKLFFMDTPQEDGKDNTRRKVTFLDPNKSCHKCAGFLAAPCKNCALCEYFLPKSRAELKDPSTLREVYNSLRLSTENCDGFSISVSEDIANIKISSSVLPRYVKHEGHSHLLSTTCIVKPTWCNACENDFAGYGFKCNFCDFTIDSYCALLPGSICHKSDKKHPFKLTFYSIEGVEEYVCEICEGDITTRWFYHCVDCDYSIHPRCIWKYHIKFGPFIIMGYRRYNTVLVPSTTSMLIECMQCQKKEVSGCHYSLVLEDFSSSIHLKCNIRSTNRWRRRTETLN